MSEVRSSVYREGRRSPRVTRTRERIMDAVRRLLAEGRFHEATVAEVAKSAGVSRATLYQHFGSRMGLVDAICETLAENPALVEVRKSAEQETAEGVLTVYFRQSIRFWASEEAIHRHLYGLAVIDPAAADFVERQQADRGAEVSRIVASISDRGSLRADIDAEQATALLMALGSFATYDELRRRAELSEDEVLRLLIEVATGRILAGAPVVR
jgi:AcrR family transcriptional regulator